MAIAKASVNGVDVLHEYINEQMKGRKHLYHFTTYENLVSILTQRCFRISNMNLLNDKAEKTLTKNGRNENSFIMSFSNSEKEYVSMWAMYGKPSGIKLRIDFPLSSFESSIDNNFFFDGDGKREIPIAWQRIAPVTKKGFLISDVIYFDKKNVLLTTYQRPFENLPVDENVINSLAGFVKYDAWEFEKETRLRVVLRDDTGQCNVSHIYAGIDDALVSEMGVCYNPWIADSLRYELIRSIDRLAGHPLHHTLSQIHGEIDEL